VSHALFELLPTVLAQRDDVGQIRGTRVQEFSLALLAQVRSGFSHLIESFICRLVSV
jgi:hypothetical protein